MAGRKNARLHPAIYFFITNIVNIALSEIQCDVCTCYPETLTVDCTDSSLWTIPTNVTLSANATSILLNGNDVNVTGYTFGDYPMLLNLDLSGNDLSASSLIGSGSSTVRNLSLSHNKISNLSDGMFAGFSNLTTLDLSKNSISTLLTGSFTSLPGLTSLDLHGNDIANIADDAFAGVSDLQVLILADNNLKNIPISVFKNIPNLEVLNLQGNLITEIRKFSFVDLPRLRTLNLAENQIISVDDRSFCGVNCVPPSSIVVLDLQQNDIAEFPSASLIPLTKLADLNFDQNVITDLNQLAVTSLGNLQKITISQSELRNIHHSAFHNLSNLQEVRIRYNKDLRHIDQDAFWSVPKLSRVYLDHNYKMVSLPKTLLDWKKLSILVLEGSNLTCDCDLQWIMDLWRTNISKEFLDSLVCSGPRPWTGIRVRKMSVHAFQCTSVHRVHLSSTENKLLYAFVISTVMFIVLVTCIMSVKFRYKIRTAIRRQFRYKHQKDDAIFVVEPPEEQTIKDGHDIEQPTEGTPMTTISLTDDTDCL